MKTVEGTLCKLMIGNHLIDRREKQTDRHTDGATSIQIQSNVTTILPMSLALQIIQSSDK